VKGAMAWYFFAMRLSAALLLGALIGA